MVRSVHPPDWQAQASIGRPSQGEMPFMAAVKALRALDAALIDRMTFNGVLADAARGCGLDDQDIADAIHVCAPYFSRLMRGVAQQWAKRIVALCRVTGSLGPVQWMAHQLGCDLVVRSAVEAERAALRARLAELERTAA
jgi:hypothetical protein